MKFFFQILLIQLLICLTFACPGCFASANLKYGVQLYHHHHYRKALTYFYEAIKKTPRDPQAYYYSGLCWEQLEQYSRAIKMYRSTIQVKPKSRWAQKATAKIESCKTAYVRKQEASAKTKKSKGSRTVHYQSSTSGASQDTLPPEARVFFKSRGTKMIVDGRINGRSIEMMFDTGAPQAGYFSVAHLKELGLPAPNRKADGKVGGSSNLATKDYWDYDVEMQVGAIKRKNIRIMVLNNEKDTPLLGQEFFKGYTYTIDYGGKSIHFKKKRSGGSSYANSSKSRYSVPFKFRENGNRIIVDLIIDGKKVPAMFDTGHTTKAVLAMKSPKQARDIGLKLTSQVVTTTGSSGSGTSHVAYARKVSLGPIEVYNARIHVSDLEQGEHRLPLLGQAFYRGWQYTIDMENKLIHFKRR